MSHTKYIIHGEGIQDIINKIAPTRINFPPKVRKIILDNQNVYISNIIVARQPIQSVYLRLLNLLSAGKFEEQRNNMNYEDVFHLFMIVTLATGKKLFIEKNEVVNMKYVSNIPPFKDMINIPINKKISFGDFINNAVKAVGPSIYLYDHINNNCQVFLRNLLNSNGLLTPELKDFIVQDVEQLLKTSPNYTNKVVDTVIQAKAKLDRLIEGEGKRKRKSKNKHIKRKSYNKI